MARQLLRRAAADTVEPGDPVHRLTRRDRGRWTIATGDRDIYFAVADGAVKFNASPWPLARSLGPVELCNESAVDMFAHPLLPADPAASLLSNVARIPARYCGEVSVTGTQLSDADLLAPIPAGRGLDTLDRLLVESIASCIGSGKSVGVLATGGLDSALIAAVAKEITGAAPTLISARRGLTSWTEDARAADLASVLGSRLVEVKEFELHTAFKKAVCDNTDSDFPLGGVFSSIWAGLVTTAEDLEVDVLLTGEGGNELFSGGGALAVDLWRRGKRRDACLQFGRVRGTNRPGFLSSLRDMRKTNFLPTKAWDDPESDFPSWYGRPRGEFAKSSERWGHQIERLTSHGCSFSETVCAARLERLELWGPTSVNSGVRVQHPLADPRLRRYYFRSGLAFEQSFGVGIGDKHHARLMARSRLPTAIADQPKVGPANQLSALRDMGLRMPTPSRAAMQFLGFDDNDELSAPESMPASMGLDWTSAYAFLAWAESNIA